MPWWPSVGILHRTYRQVCMHGMHFRVRLHSFPHARFEPVRTGICFVTFPCPEALAFLVPEALPRLGQWHGFEEPDLHTVGTCFKKRHVLIKRHVFICFWAALASYPLVPPRCTVGTLCDRASESSVRGSEGDRIQVSSSGHGCGG